MLPDKKPAKPVNPDTLTPLTPVQRNNLDVFAQFLGVMAETMDASDHPDDVVKTAKETLAEVFGTRQTPPKPTPTETKE